MSDTPARIHWVIAGGESGPGARPMHPDWVRSIRDQCVAAGVPFFFKQWGGVQKKRAGRVLDGRMWSDMPHLSDTNASHPSHARSSASRRASAIVGMADTIR
jgi:protein gp37